MQMKTFPDLRRDFDTPPYAQLIEQGRQGELRCHPPKGSPPARVSHWTRDGRRIDPATDPNFIQSSSGSLLILQARMEDTANYTCVATNDYGSDSKKTFIYPFAPAKKEGEKTE